MMLIPFDHPLTLLLVPIGFAIGLLVTLFGGGGGFFYVPILTLFFRVPTQIAAATSLAATLPTVLIGSIEHYRRGNVDLRTGLTFGFAGLVGALGGSALSGFISSVILKKLFGIYALALIIPMILTSKSRLGSRKIQQGERGSGTIGSVLIGSGFGVLSGIMAGLFGTSGTASVVAGLYLLGLPVNFVIGTSVVVVFFNATAGFVGQLAVGHIDPLLLFLLGSGSLVGAFVGPRLLAKIDATKLEKIYGIAFILLVLVFGIAMLSR